MCIERIKATRCYKHKKIIIKVPKELKVVRKSTKNCQLKYKPRYNDLDGGNHQQIPSLLLFKMPPKIFVL